MEVAYLLKPFTRPSLILLLGIVFAGGISETVVGCEPTNLPTLNIPIDSRFGLGAVGDSAPNAYVAVPEQRQILKVAPSGLVTVVVGADVSDSCDDGVLAINACLEFPTGVTVDTAGNLFIADAGANRIRKVAAATGIISTVAGTATPSVCETGTAFGNVGNGGPATEACLVFPTDVAVDADGNLFIADTGNHRVRKVDAHTRTISTVIGIGIPVDGCAACIDNPIAVTVNAAGDVFVADKQNTRTVKVQAGTGIISTYTAEALRNFCSEEGSPTPDCLDVVDNRFRVRP